MSTLTFAAIGKFVPAISVTPPAVVPIAQRRRLRTIKSVGTPKAPSFTLGRPFIPAQVRKTMPHN
jgi:hypothetical protein